MVPKKALNIAVDQVPNSHAAPYVDGAEFIISGAVGPNYARFNGSYYATDVRWPMFLHFAKLDT